MRFLELHTHPPKVVKEHLKHTARAEHIAVINYRWQIVMYKVAGKGIQVHENPKNANNGIHLHILKLLLLHDVHRAMLNVLLKWR